ncbi:MAG: hypothetical protein HZA15_00040 [Nitrospirae bacterium]|nr:hypothetical protein [Nitrospirota bacterium]
MEKISEPFEFKECIGILKATGRKAASLRELRDILAVVRAGSIYHHTYQYFMRGRFLEYTNDFAQWAGEGLGERALSEELSNIDPYEFRDIEEVRKKLLDVIDGYLGHSPAPREAMAGAEFYFNETVTIIYPAGIRAENLAEFLIAIRFIDINAIYYHFYDARVRLGTNDFSSWFDRMINKPELAAAVSAIDPFMHDLEWIRRYIAGAVEVEVQRDMEMTGGGG